MELARLINSTATAATLAEGYESLLSAFSTDRSEAELRLRGLRAKLVKIFDWRGLRDPDLAADETLERVARQLSEGLELTSDDPTRFVVGVAAHVVREILRRQRESLHAVEGLEGQEALAVAARHVTRGSESRELAALRSGLAALSRSDRELLLDYVALEGQHKIQLRRQLAMSLEITARALRLRIHRIRKRLEAATRRELDLHEHSRPGSQARDVLTSTSRGVEEWI